MEITIAEISRKLSEQSEEVCQRLLPGGKMHAGEWLCGSIGGEAGKSLKIHLTGPHAGEWKDWADQDQRGDLVDLWRIVKGIPPSEAIREIKEYLGIRDNSAVVSEKVWKRPVIGTTKELSPEGEAVKYLRDVRKLDPAIINRFRIEGDPERRAIVFPSYSPSGELINRSYRTLGADKKVWQDKDCAPSLFGWQALSDRAYRDRTVILSEGQLDCASWTQWGKDCLSIPNGSGMSWIEYEWRNLEVFDKIYLAFDMDDAGGEMRKKAIQRLGKHRCLIVRLPKKDANECLMSGFMAHDADAILLSAEAPRIDNLVRAIDLRQRLTEEATIGPAIPTMGFLNFRWPDRGFYPRPAEVTIWSGEMNQGKSSLLNFFMGTMLLRGTKVFVASLETKAEKIIKKIISSMSNSACDAGAIDTFLKECGNDLVFADCTGYLDEETLMEMMLFAFRRYDVTQFVVDSLMRIKDLEENYPKQGDFLNRLQKFTKDTGAHVHLVAHNRKTQTGDKSNAGLRIKGSSLIANNADNIIVVSRNPEKEKLLEDGKLSPEKEQTMHDAEVRIVKQRETGWMGKVNLRYCPATGYFQKFK